MNGFSLTTMFVAKSATLASAGSTDALTPGQLGIFRPDYTIATAGNIAAAKYFYVAQGRIENTPGVGSKRSDKIAAKNVLKWYKSTPEDTAANQITTVTGFTAKCNDDIVVTLRIESDNINIGYYNGLQRSVIVKAPCCECGSLPCTEVDPADIEALVDEIVEKMNEAGSTLEGGQETKIGNFVTAQRTGSGATSGIRIEGKPLPPVTERYDLRANQFERDRLIFNIFVTKGAETTVDPLYFYDRCEQQAVITQVQEPNFIHGSSAEIKRLEREFYSYQSNGFKNLFAHQDWNGAFTSYVEDGEYYDLYYIVFTHYDEVNTWGEKSNLDSTVIVAFKTGEGAAFETVLTAALGAPTDYNGEDVVTTTTAAPVTTTTTAA